MDEAGRVWDGQQRMIPRWREAEGVYIHMYFSCTILYNTITSLLHDLSKPKMHRDSRNLSYGIQLSTTPPHFLPSHHHSIPFPISPWHSRVPSQFPILYHLLPSQHLHPPTQIIPSSSPHTQPRQYPPPLGAPQPAVLQSLNQKPSALNKNHGQPTAPSSGPHKAYKEEKKNNPAANRPRQNHRDDEKAKRPPEPTLENACMQFFLLPFLHLLLSSSLSRNGLSAPRCPTGW